MGFQLVCWQRISISYNSFSNKISEFCKPKVFGPHKCTVYLGFLFIGSASLSSESNVKTAVENCSSFVITRVVHVTKPMLSPATRDLLPALQKSSVIYECMCHCDSWYVRRISQRRLQGRIRVLLIG